MATSYFLVINGIAGDYSDNLLTGAFQVGAFAETTEDSGSLAAGADPTSFDPLQLSLDSEDIAGLLAASANGTKITNASLIEETTVKGKAVVTGAINLSNVIVSDITDNGSSLTGLTLDYGQIGFVSKAFNSDGSQQPAQNFGWNVMTDSKAGAGVTLTNAGAPAVAPGTATHYYLLISGLNGGSTDAAHAGWFDLSSFGIDLSNTTDPQNPSGGAGTDVFSELSAFTANDTGLARLMQLEAQGKALTGVQIEGVDASGQAVYDLNLADVSITGVDSGSGGLAVTFDYQQVSVVTHGEDDSGDLVQTGSFGWDKSTNQAIDPSTMSSISAAQTGISVITPTSYYLVINGVVGNYSDKLVSGAFKVDASSLATSGSPSQLLGSAASPTSFGSLSLIIDSQTLPGLLAAAADGKLIQDVSLIGEASVDGNSAITYSLNLADVTLNVQASSEGLFLTLDYDSIGLVTKGLGSDGALQTAQSFGWDVTDNKSAGVGTSLTKAGAAVASTTPTSYYLLVNGIDGGSTDAAHAGWFNVADFSIDLDNHAGTTNFGGLSVAVSDQAGLAELLKQETNGKLLTGVRIEGVDASGNAVYDLNLADVVISSLDDGNGAGFTVDFDYEQVALVTSTENSSNQLVQTGSFGWDTQAKQPIDPSSMPTISAGKATSGIVAPSSYYLVIDGVAGDYSDKLVKGAFAVTELNVGAGGNSLANLGTGHTSYVPLQLTVDSQTLAGLLAAAADGKAIDHVSLVGEQTDNSKSIITYSLNLSNVIISGVDAQSNGSFGLTLDYGQIGLVTRGVDADGSLGTQQTFGWDVASKASAGPGTSLTSAGSTTLNPTLPTSYYLLVDQINGGSTDPSHPDWFNLSDFRFDVVNPSDSQTGTFGASVFGQLSVTTSGDMGLTQLLRAEANDSKVDGIRIEGVDANGVAVYDLNLADVLVTAVDNSNQSGLDISFDYGQISLATYADIKDEPQQTGSFGWDDLANQPFDPSDMPDIAPCYCRGTLILTAGGDVPVEDLAIGDMVMTMSGAARPIKWIGRRAYSGRFARGKDILPVCIKAGALEDNVPRRDLWISPHHAMYLDGILIEAIDLVNDVTIIQATEIDSVAYFHIELDTHDVLIAEGSLSESFVDDDSRGMFHNADEFVSLHPDDISAPARYCAPRCDQGYAVAAVRRRLALRAGLDMPGAREGIGALRGYVDGIDGGVIAGWAQTTDHPEAPVCLDIYVDGRLIGQTLANHYRGDLEAAGLGSGRHGFEFVLPAGLAFGAEAVEVRRALDGTALPLPRQVRPSKAAA